MDSITHPEDLWGDDFTSVGLTRNPGLLQQTFPSNILWKLVLCYQKSKKKKKILVLPK